MISPVRDGWAADSHPDDAGQGSASPGIDGEEAGSVASGAVDLGPCEVQPVRFTPTRRPGALLLALPILAVAATLVPGAGLVAVFVVLAPVVGLAATVREARRPLVGAGPVCLPPPRLALARSLTRRGPPV